MYISVNVVYHLIIMEHIILAKHSMYTLLVLLQYENILIIYML